MKKIFGVFLMCLVALSLPVAAYQDENLLHVETAISYDVNKLDILDTIESWSGDNFNRDTVAALLALPDYALLELYAPFATIVEELMYTYGDRMAGWFNNFTLDGYYLSVGRAHIIFIISSYTPDSFRDMKMNRVAQMMQQNDANMLVMEMGYALDGTNDSAEIDKLWEHSQSIQFMSAEELAYARKLIDGGMSFIDAIQQVSPRVTSVHVMGFSFPTDYYLNRSFRFNITLNTRRHFDGSDSGMYISHPDVTTLVGPSGNIRVGLGINSRTRPDPTFTISVIWSAPDGNAFLQFTYRRARPFW